MNEESVIIYEHNSYDMLRTWYSLSYQPINHFDMIDSQLRMSDAMRMVADLCVLRQWVCVANEHKGVIYE